MSGWLAVDDGFEGLFVFDDEGGAHHLENLLSAEVGEETRDGFAGRADHLGNFFVGESDLDANLTFFFGIIRGPFEEEASEFLAGGMRKADGAHFGDGGMIGFAKLLCDAQCSLTVVFEEAEKFVAPDEIGLGRFNHIGSEFVTCAGDGSGEAENFTGFGDAENESFAVGGRGGKFDATAAENKDSTRGLSFDEKGGSLRIRRGRSNRSHGLDRSVREIAKKALFAVRAREAVFNNLQAVRSAHTDSFGE